MTDTRSLVAAVNKQLLAGEPENISIDTFNGYAGYKPQCVIDAMNEAFDIGGWGFDELDSWIEDGIALCKVRVWIEGCAFQPTSYGQARVTKGDIGDARKGAQTDSIKKALSYFSIGSRAYRGELSPIKQERR